MKILKISSFFPYVNKNISISKYFVRCIHFFFAAGFLGGHYYWIRGVMGHLVSVGTRCLPSRNWRCSDQSNYFLSNSLKKTNLWKLCINHWNVNCPIPGKNTDNLFGMTIISYTKDDCPYQVVREYNNVFSNMNYISNICIVPFNYISSPIWIKEFISFIP